MEDVVPASTEADAQAAAQLVAHHAEIDATLALKAEVVTTGARSGHHDAAAQARTALLEWCHQTLVPHVMAAESTLCRAGAEIPAGRLLVEAMVVEHRIIRDLVSQVEESDDALDTTVLVHSLRQLFSVHLSKVNDQLLPLLVQAPGVRVADLVPELQELVSSSDDGAPSSDDGYGHPSHDPTAYACEERDLSDFPELDARAVPQAIRHATVFGALDAVRPGKALVLVAPHDPIPLLRQLEGRQPGVFEVEYLQRGPQAWRLLVTRNPE